MAATGWQQWIMFKFKEIVKTNQTVVTEHL